MFPSTSFHGERHRYILDVREHRESCERRAGRDLDFSVGLPRAWGQQRIFDGHKGRLETALIIARLKTDKRRSAGLRHPAIIIGGDAFEYLQRLIEAIGPHALRVLGSPARE